MKSWSHQLLTFPPPAQWCLSIEGFAGWLSGAWVQRDWMNGPPFRNDHPLGGAGSDPATQDRLARLLTAASCVLNMAAQRDRLLFGGGAGRGGAGRGEARRDEVKGFRGRSKRWRSCLLLFREL